MRFILALSLLTFLLASATASLCVLFPPTEGLSVVCCLAAATISATIMCWTASDMRAERRERDRKVIEAITTILRERQEKGIRGRAKQ